MSIKFITFYCKNFFSKKVIRTFLDNKFLGTK